MAVKSVYVPSLSLRRFDMFYCACIASQINSLLLNQVGKVFFGIPFFIETWNFGDSSSTPFNAAYFSLIDFVLSFLFVATVAIVKCKQNNSDKLSMQYAEGYKLQLNLNIKIKLSFTLECNVFMEFWVKINVVTVSSFHFVFNKLCVHVICKWLEILATDHTDSWKYPCNHTIDCNRHCTFNGVIL